MPELDLPEEPPLPVKVILAGDYEYLTEGYYECQDVELGGGFQAVPTCAETLDAYVVPVALEKAACAGLAVPEWYLTNEYFTPPAVVYGVNPFSRRHAVVRTEAEREEAAKKLTWNFKYTMCCQRIRPETELVELRMAAGRTEDERWAEWAADVHRVFRLPLATVRLLVTGDLVQLSAVEILPLRSLNRRERAWAEALARGDHG